MGVDDGTETERSRLKWVLRNFLIFLVVSIWGLLPVFQQHAILNQPHLHFPIIISSSRPFVMQKSARMSVYMFSPTLIWKMSSGKRSRERKMGFPTFSFLTGINIQLSREFTQFFIHPPKSWLLTPTTTPREFLWFLIFLRRLALYKRGILIHF